MIYKGRTPPVGYRIDLLVDSTAVVEIKAVEALLAIHSAQLLTYLKEDGYQVGLLLNFVLSSAWGLCCAWEDRPHASFHP